MCSIAIKIPDEVLYDTKMKLMLLPRKLLL